MLYRVTPHCQGFESLMLEFGTRLLVVILGALTFVSTPGVGNAGLDMDPWQPSLPKGGDELLEVQHERLS